MNIFASTIPNAANSPAESAIDSIYAVTALAASGAISVTQGYCPITASGVAVLTLAAPAAGLPSAGGNDGQRLVLHDTTGHAHTVTTPANKLNGNVHVATFAGTVGNYLEVRAYNGVWYVTGSAGITLS